MIFITSIIATIPIGIYYLISDYNVFKHITPAIDSLVHFSVRDYLVNYVQTSYDSQTSDVVCLLIFNIKKGAGWEVYQTMIDLSVVYLIVIGGLHLSFVQSVLLKIFKKHQLPVKIFNNIFSFFYTYLLNFSVSTSRVILSNACGTLKCHWKLSPYDKCALAGSISMFICPSIITNLGFNLSYLCTIGIIFIYQLKIKNLLLRQICINTFACLISLPFVIQINKSISLFAIINSFLFSYFIIIIFVIMLLTFWIKWIYPVQKWITSAIVYIVQGFGLINVQINLQPWPNIINAAFYTILLSGAIYLVNRQNFYLKY